MVTELDSSEKSFSNTMYFLFIGVTIFLLGVLWANMFTEFFNYWNACNSDSRLEKRRLTANLFVFTFLITVFFIMILYLIGNGHSITIT